MTRAVRLLGVDFGTVRVGLAASDPETGIAFPLATYTRQGSERDARRFRDLVSAERIGRIVVGLPVHLKGNEGTKAAEARAFGGWLAQATGVPVVFWDERFTTVEAERLLLGAHLTNRRRKDRRDRVAAQIMLQSYIDAGAPDEPDVRPLEGDERGR